ncbi:MAG TPA: ABC transporter permease, partial [Bryobacteraceae bacterium]|nr:ABC transporter permease [Bryobacteraceae bacterium]
MWRRKRKHSDFDAEITAHLDLETDRLIAEGMSPEDARYRAQRTFGNTTSARERFYESGRVLWFDQLTQDLHFAVRMLRKSPGFSGVAVLTLALGIGANTAIFSVVNGVVLRPLPYPDPDRLVSIWERIGGLGGESTFAYFNFLDCQRESRSFERMAAWRGGDGVMSGPGEAERLRGRQISAELLDVLGVRPALGRGFLPEEDRAGAAPVAIISDGLWRRRFGSDPHAAGGQLLFNGKAYAIVGVLPPDFRYFRSMDIFTPIGQNTDFPLRNREMHPGIRVIARVRPEISLPQAQLEMNLIAQRLAAAYPKSNADHGLMVRPLIEDFVGDVRRTLFLLLGAVGVVLLIACANVAGLLLARSVSRSREFAIRTALGASRWRVVRQALTESILLAIGGGALGFLIASWGTGPLLLAMPDHLPRMEEVAPDIHVFLFTLGATLLTGILFGLAPALQDFSAHPEQALKQGARTVTGGPRRLQTTFVVAETALALVLLVGAGLMIRTVLRLWSVNPGFDPKSVLTANVRLSPSVMGEPAQIRTAWDQLLESVRRIPGVRNAAAADVIPLTGSDEQTQDWTRLPPPSPDRLP